MTVEATIVVRGMVFKRTFESPDDSLQFEMRTECVCGKLAEEAAEWLREFKRT